MTDRSRARALTRLLATALAIVPLWACTGPTAPFDPFGTYHLVACELASTVPPPCVYPNGVPGDSTRLEASTFTLGDSTFTTTLDESTWSGGAWSTPHVGTVTGQVLIFGKQDTMFALVYPNGPLTTNGSAVISQGRMVVNTWLIYVR